MLFKFLLEELRRILALDREWRACLVGVGRLGRAIINYTGFAPEGFIIVSAFDIDHDQVGDQVGDLRVRRISELSQTIRDLGITIGIVAVPAERAQSVIDQLVKYRIRGILNYAPIAPNIPVGIILRNIDPVVALQSMTFYLQNSE